MANKHHNKRNGYIPITEAQKGRVTELEVTIMKARQLRVQEHDRKVSMENQQMEDLANALAAECEVDIKQWFLSLDTYRFEPRASRTKD